MVEFDLLFETSWEVCNKVGGIYTVLSTVAKNLHKNYDDKLIFIGPDVWSESNPSPYFSESKSLLKSWLAQLSLPRGVTVRVGRWNIPGRPIAILVGFQGMYAVRNRLYARMWELYGVDSLHAYGDYDEACAFSHAAALVIEDLARFSGCEKGKNVITHFHEWTTGMGLLCVKDALPSAATVFTTHATCIGRSICGNGKPLYDYLRAYNGDQMARELNMESKHSLEKTAAHQADCFTTVSDVTARECEQLLERRPDVITVNGFEADFVPGPRKYKKAREISRSAILSVASALTGNNYASDTFIIATSGRCEYRNKGIDLYLDSIDRLRRLAPGRKIVALVLVPAWSDVARTDLVDAIKNKTGKALPDPVCTHALHNYDEDPIISRIRQLGFVNNADSAVTVVYVPCYLNGNDGVFGLSYYDLLPGIDATVFPSYYEPWGYTPLESVAFGIPTVTTSLSGFGQWVLSDCRDGFAESGVEVVMRGDFNYDEVADAIASHLKSLADTPAKQYEAFHKAAFATADKASWLLFVRYYQDAFEIATSNVKSRNN